MSMTRPLPSTVGGKMEKGRTGSLKIRITFVLSSYLYTSGPG